MTMMGLEGFEKMGDGTANVPRVRDSTTLLTMVAANEREDDDGTANVPQA